MRKNVLLLTIMLLGLAFSSCLKMDGEEHFYGNDYSFISTNAAGVKIARIYNRSLGFLAITSDEIQKDLQLGECYFISYEWSSNMGTIYGTDMSVFNAKIVGDPTHIDKATLNLCQELPSVDEEDIQFFNMRPNIYGSNVYSYFDDNWLVEFSYQGKKGETVSLSFYLLDEQPVSDEYVIDVIMTKSGEGEGNSNKKTDYVVVNLGQIRDFYSSKVSDPENVSIKFRFHSIEQNGLYTTPAFIMEV